MEELNNLITRMEEAGMSPDAIRSKLEELEATNPELFQEPEFPRQQPFTFNNKLQTVDQQDEPGTIKSLVSSFAKGFATAAKGAFSDLPIFLNMQGKFFNERVFGDGDISLEDRKKFRQEAETEAIVAGTLYKTGMGAGLDPTLWDKTIGFLDENIREYEEETISQQFGKAETIGDYALVGERAVGAALESAPSLLAAFYGAGALGIYGGSLVGDKYLEEFDKDPEKANSRLLASAIGTSAIEVGFEFATRGLMKRAGILAVNGQKQAAKTLIRGGAESMVKKVGIGLTGEAAAEASTELTSLIYDAAVLNGSLNKAGWDGVTGIDWNKEKYRIFDAGIVGSIMGGGVSTLGAIKNNDTKSRAEDILMPNNIKSKIFESGDRISKLVDESSSLDQDGIETITNEINKEQAKINKLRRQNSANLNIMTTDELINYATNKNNIAKITNQLKKINKNTELYAIKKIEYDNLVKENNKLYNQVNKRRIQENLNVTRKTAKKIGLKVNTINNPEDFQKKYDATGRESMDVTGADGFIIGDQIYINKSEAMKVGSVSVGSHELLHGILRNTINDVNGNLLFSTNRLTINLIKMAPKNNTKNMLKNI